MAKKKVSDFVFVDGLECVMCGQKDRPVAAGLPEAENESPKKGICEVCAVRVYWDFKSEPGDVPPGLDTTKTRKISKVKVLVPRLRKAEDGSALEPSFVDAYEFALVQNGKHWDLPTEDFDTDEVTTALRALDKASLVSWKWCIEPLYRGYTPRGGLVSVVLAIAHAKKAMDTKIEFRAWPLEKYVEPGLAGLYSALSEVWGLRLYKWAKILKPSNGIAVFVREAAREYIRLKLAMKSSSDDLDTSMIEYYRKTLTPDEKYVCELCLGGEKVDEDLRSQTPKADLKPFKPVETTQPVEGSENEDSDKTDMLEDFDRMESEDDADEVEPPDGFIRQGNVLSVDK